ncbi:mitochondrial ribosomal protein L3 [Augochlora pura]
MASVLRTFKNFQLFSKHLQTSINILPVRSHGRLNPPPRKRHPEWLPKPQRPLYNEDLTRKNKEFLSEVVASKVLTQKSVLKADIINPDQEWTKQSRRTGLIGKKIGIYPMWLKNGRRVLATLIQIIDNEVVKYIPPEKYVPVVQRWKQVKTKNGCLIVGAQNVDPQITTKQYYGIFESCGVTPKKVLMRFVVTPNAALPSGTPLNVTHFKPGEYLDIRGKTVDRGFQGVMKRWGFKGMPKSHGVTKTHRRGGNIGSGGKKARVMPGTKMPGHMGNRWRILRGVKILRINTKYNVLWVYAPNLPGETNNMLYLYDTILPTKKNTSPNFPTYFPNSDEDKLPENLYADDVHPFNDPTIEFKPES